MSQPYDGAPDTSARKSAAASGDAPDREAVARALCKQYELDDGFSEEQAQRASESDMYRNFLKAADAAIAALSVSRPLRGGK